MSEGRPDRLVSFWRRIRGRCCQCGARDWAASYDGYTLPEPVCRECGYRPQSESSGGLIYHLIALGIIVAALLTAVVALFVFVMHHYRVALFSCNPIAILAAVRG
jgi:uncharacterized protein (DUF983 family)